MAMTKQQFIDYWLAGDEDGRSRLSYNEESLAEHAAEFAGECALFGDGGPGMGLRLREMRGELARVKARLAQFGAL